jgi:hypothetical protein
MEMNFVPKPGFENPFAPVVNHQEKEQLTPKKEQFEKLSGLMEVIAAEINTCIENEYGMTGLIDDQCTIIMRRYFRKNKQGGGIYSSEEVKIHESKIEKMEKKWLDAENEGVKSNFGEEKTLEKMKAERASSKNKLMEMAVTAVLHKFLGEEFIIVRTSTYDDYFGKDKKDGKEIYIGGADNLIVHKATGEVLCGIDECHEGGKGETIEKKEQKMRKIAQSGGVDVAYGMTIEDKQLKLTSLKNVPVFYISLMRDELNELLEKMSYDNTKSKKTLPVEQKFFGKFVASIISQKEELDRLKEQGALVGNLRPFEASFERIREIAGI